METCKCPNGCGVDLRYEGNRQWVCPICDDVYDLEWIDTEGEEESLDIHDAAQIWVSRGKDEDYTFGYSEDELEDALKKRATHYLKQPVFCSSFHHSLT